MRKFYCDAFSLVLLKIVRFLSFATFCYGSRGQEEFLG